MLIAGCRDSGPEAEEPASVRGGRGGLQPKVVFLEANPLRLVLGWEKRCRGRAACGWGLLRGCAQGACREPAP